MQVSAEDVGEGNVKPSKKPETNYEILYDDYNNTSLAVIA